MMLSEHFSLAELTVTDHGENTPTPAHLYAMRKYLAPGLEAARLIVGGPLIVTSGYRNPRVNAIVGGVDTSAHALGYAGDVKPGRILAGGRSPGYPSITPLQLAVRLAHRPDFMKLVDQLIYETSRGIVHLSFDPRARGQVRTQAGPAGSPVTIGLPI